MHPKPLRMLILDHPRVRLLLHPAAALTHATGHPHRRRAPSQDQKPDLAGPREKGTD
ncbi:hypothetical protein [Streptomyces cavernicola]|uniref:Uncharacterized protein n=1 Tax=Streptomyces cavernicola TaxID=3043613 RepID=A0ABT6SG21_9ACTN|nr:hypothetical protein [Streptomyces sp. B-S-A6]MDI3406919.1 hypothetical protein [Streptomyces sp. B-S-A6]